MHHATAVGMTKATLQLCEDGRQLMSTKSSATPQQMFFERASLQVLHHQEGACVRVVASIGHVDDVTATQSRSSGRLFQ
jgi:hypothetical protein